MTQQAAEQKKIFGWRGKILRVDLAQKKIWEEEGLPPLTPRVPWFGYSLGYWTHQDEEEAPLALRGEHYQTAKRMHDGKIEG